MNYIVQSALEERRQHFVSKRSVWNQLTTTAFFIVANLIQFSSFAGQKWPKTAWTQGKSKCVELQGLYQRPAVTRSRKTGSVIFIFKHSTATESRNNLGRYAYTDFGRQTWAGSIHAPSWPEAVQLHQCSVRPELVYFASKAYYLSLVLNQD